MAKLKIKEWGEVRDPFFLDISQVKSTALKWHSWIRIRIAQRRIRIQKPKIDKNFVAKLKI
jgi:hypothetical protein